MEYLSRENLDQLLTIEPHTPAVTIYIPMLATAAPPHITEKQIRFKNLITRAIEQLENIQKGSALIKELRQYQQKLQDDLEFWKDQTAGLLICAAPGLFRLFHLPYDTEEFVSVGDNFFLAPVLSILHDAQSYYVLTIAQQKPQLFNGDLYGLHPTDLQLPTDVATALNIDENNQKSENQSSAMGSSLSTQGFNGRGGGRNPAENDRLQFFRIVDTMVNRYIHADTPLILAGIDAEVAEYRAISKYPRILESSIVGSYSNIKPEDVSSEAARIIEQEIVLPAHSAVIEEYKQIHGANPDRSATDKTAIAEAAEQGRIDKLLVRMTRTTTDVVRDTMQAAKRITFPEAEISTSLNDLAIKVWQMSGTVIGLAANEIPNGAPMVARLRY